MCRHHVVGQARAQRLAQVADQRWGRVAGDEVGDELLVARRVLAVDDGDLADGRVLGDRGLDLAELDAEAADLDLLVDAAEVLEFAAVAGAGPDRRCGTCAPSRCERVGHEALRGQLGAVEIAAATPAPATYISPATPIGTGWPCASSR